MNEALCAETNTAKVLSGWSSIMLHTEILVLVDVLAAASVNRCARLFETRTEFDGCLCESIHRDHFLVLRHDSRHSYQLNPTGSSYANSPIAPNALLHGYLRARCKQQSVQSNGR